MHHQARPYVQALEAERPRTAGAPRGLDRRMLPEIVTQFSARIRKVASHYRLPAHDVEDVMQTTWVRLLEHGDGIRDARAIGAWLETTARRESLRVLHRAGREQPTDCQLLANEATAPVDEDRLAARERQAAIASAIAALTDRQRDIISALTLDPPPSYAEIAQLLGMPIGSIGPTRARIIERLRASRHLAAVSL
jgi:RNA polymerase sigma factor (sigma-70 family)